jgi:hypothetical protein
MSEATIEKMKYKAHLTSFNVIEDVKVGDIVRLVANTTSSFNKIGDIGVVCVVDYQGQIGVTTPHSTTTYGGGLGPIYSEVDDLYLYQGLEYTELCPGIEYEFKDSELKKKYNDSFIFVGENKEAIYMIPLSTNNFSYSDIYEDCVAFPISSKDKFGAIHECGKRAQRLP